jgi:hypothetical protein
MSAAFTSPYDWARGGQDLAGANEIMRAWYERAYATFYSGSIISPLTVGTDAQARELWGGPYWYHPYSFGLQGLLEGKRTNGDSGAVSGHPSFVDHVNGPLTEAGDSFLYFTRAAWQEAAGLNVSAVDGESYRRVTEMDEDGNPVFGQFGYIQVGDIRGPWIFEDLQKGLAALKWVTFPPPVYYGGEYEDWGISAFDGLEKYGSSNPPHHNKEDAYASAIANWNAQAWTVPWYHPDRQGKLCWMYKKHGWGEEWPVYVECLLAATRWKYNLYAPTFCSRAIELWVKAGYPDFYGIGVYAPEDEEFDDNGDCAGGTVEFNKLVKVHDVGDCMTQPIATDYLTSDEAPLIGSEPAVDHQLYTGWSDSGEILLVKFNFTNA